MVPGLLTPQVYHIRAIILPKKKRARTNQSWPRPVYPLELLSYYTTSRDRKSAIKPAMAALPASNFGPEPSQYSTEFDPSQMEFMSGESVAAAESTSTGESNFVPRPKRIACVVCRRRKLRCDGRRPSCGTCSRLGHECSYDEVRKKSGPKRGYVKQLEARLGTKSSKALVANAVLTVSYIANDHNYISSSRDSSQRPGSGTHPTNLPTSTIG